MSRKSKIDPTEKVKIVEQLLAEEIGVSEAARLTGVDDASIRLWRNLYLADGPTALMVPLPLWFNAITRVILRN